ncbi:hypothetical protein HYS50_02535 [Candidatus Woesearchaeota archaeon]|nr:hypothetical protein [Candidatus Woesearchaeota archaeon]
MLTLVLGIITALFVAFLVLKPFIKRLFHLDLCVLCASVATTWLGMLLLKILGFSIDTTLLAILLGESVTGIMYRLTYSLKHKQKRNPLLGLFLILLGTTAAYSVVAGILELSSLFILVPVFIVLLFISLLRQRPNSPQSKQLLKQLEHCCS